MRIIVTNNRQFCLKSAATIHVPLILFSILFLLSSMPVLSSANSEWENTQPEQVNISAELGVKLDQAFAENELKNLHSVLVIRHNKIAIEKYYTGQDEIWGTPSGEIQFDQRTLHDLRSITKSIVSLLYGIALQDKKVPTVDAPIIDSFKQYKELAENKELEKITIGHVLSMTMGLEWNENVPYSNPANSEIAMENAADRYQYILSRDVLFPAGQKWEYSGGTTALIAHLITTGAGKTLLEYAQEKLFGPLEIEAEWTKGFNGEESAASGLRMTPRDLVRIGQLILNRGEWNGKQLISKSWLDESFEQHAETGDGLSYGYQWWLGTMRKNGSKWISGFGNGSQASNHCAILGFGRGNYSRELQSA